MECLVYNCLHNYLQFINFFHSNNKASGRTTSVLLICWLWWMDGQLLTTLVEGGYDIPRFLKGIWRGQFYAFHPILKFYLAPSSVQKYLSSLIPKRLKYSETYPKEPQNHLGVWVPQRWFFYIIWETLGHPQITHPNAVWAKMFGAITRNHKQRCNIDCRRNYSLRAVKSRNSLPAEIFQ